MPTKASITTRTGKGSPLTTAEMDNNLTNLRDQSIAIADDTSTAIDVESGNTLTIAGSGTVSTAAAGQTLTITGTGITATSTDTLENKTIDTANNTITVAEADISDLGSYITDVVSDTTPQLGGDLDAQTNNITNLGTLNTHTVPGGTGTLALTSDITFTDVVSDTTPQLGGDLDVNGNSIVSVSNGNIVIAPNGTGDVDLDGEVRFNKNYKEDINALTSSSTITVDCTLAPIHTVTLATNTEFNITGLPTGGSVTLIITQDGTGTRTATFGTDSSTAVKFAGGTPTLSTAGNAIDVVTITNDGTNFLGNLAKAFAA